MAAINQKDASDVGVPCSICSIIDFLPIRCQYCRQAFCKEHARVALPTEHTCPDYHGLSTIVADHERGRDGSATFSSLLPDRSAKTSSTIASPEEQQKQAKKEAALAVLHKHFPGTSSSSQSTAQQVKPKPVNKTVALMKLKQSAKALDARSEKSTPLKERRYFYATPASSGDTDHPFWLPKTCSCGKALDLLCTALAIPNQNNVSSTPTSERVHLVIATADTCSALPTDKTIGDTVADADTVRIVKTSEL